MAINWIRFENNVTQYIKSYSAKKEEDLARFIANEYDRVIRSEAQDVNYRNSIKVVNKESLFRLISNAFTSAKLDRTGSISRRAIKELFSAGIITYWTGAILGNEFPPPGSIQVINNTVTNPGTPPQIEFDNYRDARQFAKVLSIQFKLHLMTITGITTSLSAASPNPPIPFPFNGIN